MNKLTRISALSLMLALAGCSFYTAVPPTRTSVMDTLSVQPTLAWAKVDRATPDRVLFADSGPVETWTIDGEALDSMVFFAGIANGQPLLDLPAERGHLSAFRSTMTPNDVMDLFEAMLVTTTGSAVAKARDLRPAKLGNADGFRFDIDYTLKDDVDRQLSAVGAIRNGRLYLIAFQGDKLYHYKQYLPEFERIVASANFSAS